MTDWRSSFDAGWASLKTLGGGKRGLISQCLLQSVTSKRIQQLVFNGLVAVLLMLGMTLGSSKTLPVAHALPLGVDCGDAYNGHCYANQTWGGAIGAKTSITVVPLTCTYSSGACDFIDNEMWLIDDGNLCSFCMVEAGYWNDPFDGHTESYFWGDQTPSGQL